MRTNNEALGEGQPGEWLAGQSVIRDSAQAKAKARWMVGGISVMMVVLIAALVPDIPVPVEVGIALIGVVAVGLWGYFPLAKGNKATADGVDTAIAEALGLTFQPEVEAGEEFVVASRFGLVPGHDRGEFADRWAGTIKGHEFELYAADLAEQRGSGAGQRFVTVFRGTVIRMSFGRNFGSTTLLQRAGAHQTRMGLGGSKDSINADGHLLSRVDHVDPDFAEAFSLFSDDPAEARALVHPILVEQLLALESTFAARELRALLVGGDMIIALEGDHRLAGAPNGLGSAADRSRRMAARIGALTALAESTNRVARDQISLPAQRSVRQP